MHFTNWFGQHLAWSCEKKKCFLGFTSLEMLTVAGEIHWRGSKVRVHQGGAQQKHLSKVAVRGEESFLSIKQLHHWSFITVGSKTSYCLLVP